MRAEVVGGNPSPEHVAAIVAALAVLQAQADAAAASARTASLAPDQLRMWVEASRRSAQRSGLQRGPWRMSGRIARRSRT